LVRFVPGAGVLKEGLVLTEEKIKERFYVVRAAALADDVEVGVVFMDLPNGHFRTRGTTGTPLARKYSGLKSINQEQDPDKRGDLSFSVSGVRPHTGKPFPIVKR
jgi:hypothetical protein